MIDKRRILNNINIIRILCGMGGLVNVFLKVFFLWVFF